MSAVGVGGGVPTVRGGESVFGCKGPLRPERCAGVGIGRSEVRGVMWGGWLLCGGSTSKGPLHTTSISLRNNFSESHTWRLVSWKALTALNACWTLPVYPVLRSNEKIGQPTNRIKKTGRTNIIAKLCLRAINNYLAWVTSIEFKLYSQFTSQLRTNLNLITERGSHFIVWRMSCPYRK